MTFFHFHTDLDDPLELVVAIAEATGEEDVQLLHSWEGCDRDSGGTIAGQRTGAVNIEWLRRGGRFSLDVRVFGASFAPRQTGARLARAIAKALHRPVLFSDCSADPLSYFSAEPDGSIWLQSLVASEADIMDVEATTHHDPRHCRPRRIVAPDAMLPDRPPGSPISWQHGDLTCETGEHSGLCRLFYAPCPKRFTSFCQIRAGADGR